MQADQDRMGPKYMFYDDIKPVLRRRRKKLGRERSGPVIPVLVTRRESREKEGERERERVG